jgi:hypothetical protein
MEEPKLTLAQSKSDLIQIRLREGGQISAFGIG